MEGEVNEELIYQMSMCEYYKAEFDKAQAKIKELTEKCEQQEKRIKELESLLNEKGGFPMKMEEIKEPPKKELCEEDTKPKEPELISNINMEMTGHTQFYFIADEKNPPVRKGDKVYIAGELTKGKFVEMRPEIRDSVTYYVAKLIVQPGYKYTFFFKVGEVCTTDAHFPVYTTKIGRNVNCLNIQDPRKGKQSKMLTFIDRNMHALEKKRLEDLYRQVISGTELPLLKELQKYVGSLYYGIEDLGVLQLSSVNPSDGKIVLKRLTDQHFIPLAPTNKYQEVKDYSELTKEFLPIPKEDATIKLAELDGVKLTILYQSLSLDECSLIGTTPQVAIEDYEIHYQENPRRPLLVRNRMYGDICWNAEQVDNEYAFLTLAPIEIFGQVLEEGVYNLLHVHISALGESATVDIEYMKLGETPENYYNISNIKY